MAWGAGRVPDLVRALALSSADELAGRLRGTRAARGPLEPNEVPTARDLLDRHLPEHAQAVVERADRILAGELWLFGAWRPHARGELVPGVAAVDWTRDPLSGTAAVEESATVRRKGGREASVQPRDRTSWAPLLRPDPRSIWEAGRLAHVLWLAQADVVQGFFGTERSRGAREPGLYARALALHVRDFVATQPVGAAPHWTSPMEVALRAIHLALALLYVRTSPELDATFLVEAAEALWQHGRFLALELEDGQAVPGNHLLADLAGLSVLGLAFPELPGALRWRAKALPAFGEALLRQTSADGFAFEASLPYHRFATELGLVVQALARRQGTGLGPDALARLWKMAGVIERATLADGRLANLGDNDSSHAFLVEPRAALDGSQVVALAAGLGAPVLPSGIAPESLWIGGLAGLRRNLAVLSEPDRRRPGARSFQADGLVVLDDGRGRSATLWAGANGQRGLGGHAHNDKLACEVCLGGRRLVIDPGCPVYLGDPEERDRYRSTRAHPTLSVDGMEQAPLPHGAPFLLPEGAGAKLIEVGSDHAAGEHRGYARLRPGAIHRREVALPPGMPAVVVTDRLVGEGAHVAEIVWPLAWREVALREPTVEERAVLQALEALPVGEGRFGSERVAVLSEAGRAVALLAFASEAPFELTLVESTYSVGYGERECGRILRVTVRAQLPIAVTSVLVALVPRLPSG